jgi:hypothetical protein
MPLEGKISLRHDEIIDNNLVSGAADRFEEVAGDGRLILRLTDQKSQDDRGIQSNSHFDSCAHPLAMLSRILSIE